MVRFQELADKAGIQLTPLPTQPKPTGRSFADLASRAGIELQALPPKEIQKPPTLGEKAKDIAVGVSKRFLGQRREEAKFLKPIVKKVPITPATIPLKIGFKLFSTFFKEIPEKLEEFFGAEKGALTEPVGELEKKAATAESIAEFFIPTGFATGVGVKAIKVAKSKSLLKNILKKIAEPITKKTKQVALKEERVKRGVNILGLFKRPDKILPAEKTKQAAQTIINEIPNAGKLNDAQILVQAEQKIARIGGELSPQLKEVPVELSKTSGLIDRYGGLREKIAEQSLSDIEDQALKRISNTFENVLVEAVDAKNLDEVWKLRIRFDQKIPERVKRATLKSSPQDQIAKDAWLTYRSLLNSFIDSTADEIADVAVKADFNKMSDLYTAITNIVARADFDKKGTRIGIRNLLRFAGIGAGGFGLGTLLD